MYVMAINCVNCLVIIFCLMVFCNNVLNYKFRLLTVNLYGVTNLNDPRNDIDYRIENTVAK